MMIEISLGTLVLLVLLSILVGMWGLSWLARRISGAGPGLAAALAEGFNPILHWAAEPVTSIQ
jgi:hypothetical protein